MCTYLDRRGATYRFRRIIPAELRPILGRSEWAISLKTKDRAEAKRLIPAHTIETDAQIASARRKLARGDVPAPQSDGQPLDPETLEHLAWQAAEDARREHRREKLEPFIAFLEAKLKGSTQEMPRALRSFRYILDDMRSDRDMLRDHLAAARAELAEHKKSDLSPVDGATTAPVSSQMSVISGVPILATCDAYAAAQAMTSGVAKEWRASMKALVAFVGHDDATSLTTQDVLRWRDALASERTNRGTLRDPLTVKKRIGAVASMLRWAVEEQKLSTNVAASVVENTEETKATRRRFYRRGGPPHSER